MVGKTITITLPDKWSLLSIIAIILSLLNSYFLINIYLEKNATKTGMVVPPTEQNQNLPSAQQRIQVSPDDDPTKGSANAKVTMIEFSDFQCPFCARFWKDTLPLLEEEYIKTGKLKFVYRDFPLDFHQFAKKAAEAAECANEQNKFWEYHDKLFENQQALDITSLKRYAQELGLDTAKFNECLDSGKYANEVQKDVQDGMAYGVSGTPTFFINGIKVVGAQPYSVFKRIIDQELAS
ncbi:MAG: DsbA family protein [Candidatus Aenigmatarchaeota archaeon]